jgi:hypothetical protein
MALTYQEDAKPSMKWGFFGKEKRGKTHDMCSTAITAIRELNLTGNIACIATENWVPDWLERLKEHSGKKVAVCKTRDPKDALAFAKECEKSGEISLLLVDCASDLLLCEREKFMDKNNRSPDGGEWTMCDRSFTRFMEWCAFTQMHWLVTLREDDDKERVGGKEQVIGKCGKSKLTEVCRPLVHCRLVRGEKGPEFETFVKNTAGPSVTFKNPTSKEWATLMERYK